MDRILWNNRAENDIDEIVLHDVTVHVEQMHDRCYWIGIYRDGVERYWSGNFVMRGRRMVFTEQENGGIEWASDREQHAVP